MRTQRFFNMRKVMQGVAGTLLIMSMVACNTDTDVFNPDEDGGGSGGSGKVENANLELIVSKKGSLLSQGTWVDGNTLGLFLTQGTLNRPYQNNAELYSNIKAYMYAGWWYLTPEEIPLTDKEAVVFAYGPYKKSADPFAVPVETASCTDYMFGTHLESQTSVDALSPIATLEMQHALSLMDIHVRKNHNFKSQALLQEITIEAANDSLKLPVKGTMNIMTGKITPDGYGKYTLDNLNQVLADEYRDSCSYRMTLMPRDNVKGEVNLTIVVNGNRLSLPLHEDHDWGAGVHNTYNIIFDGTDLRLDKIEINPWKEVYIEGVIEGR